MPRLAPYVVGVAEPLAHQALVDAAIQFCEETGVIRLTTDPVPTVAGQALYDIDLPTGVALSRILKVWVNDALVYAAPEAATDDPRGLSQLATSSPGSPLAAVSLEPATVALVPAPDTSGVSLMVRAATRPTRVAKVLDDELYNRWCDAIVAGATYRLCAVPGQPFSDPGQAQRAEGVFWQQVNRAKVHSSRGPMGGVLAVRQRPFV